MVNVWFTSDTHFGHARIIELCNRPFDSVDEMNEVMIDRWNAAVSPNDIVFHLGDVAMGTLTESLPLVGRLNGRKTLIVGNHDRIFRGNKPAYQERFLPVYQEVFEDIWDELPHGDGFNMSHFPYSGDSHEEDRYTEFRPFNDGDWLVHGHVHEEWKVNGKQINVGVDVWDFRPVHLDQLLEIMGDSE